MTEHESTNSSSGRGSLTLFLFYLTVYGGFVGVNTFSPTTMAQEVVAGLNLAVVWGCTLIVLAVVLAVLYVSLNLQDPPPKSDSISHG